MMTRRFVLLGLASAGLFVLTAIPLVAQDRPDFSGTWVVEQVDVQMPQGGPARGQGGFGGGGFGRRGGGEPGARQGRGGAFGAVFENGDRVSIRQTANALIVSDERRSQISSYPIDGRETSNPGVGDNMVKTKTRWEGVALVTESAQTVSGPQGERTITMREVRSLSADGRTMTLVLKPERFPGASTTVTFMRADHLP
jgi:hypothetical protein